jgi:ATPase family associated with various cellular activities (AAA)
VWQEQARRAAPARRLPGPLAAPGGTGDAGPGGAAGGPGTAAAGLGRVLADGELPAGLDPGAVTAQFRLAPEQIARAARAARLAAATVGRALGPAELLAGAGDQNAAGLERLARRVEPRVGWDDLVLPEPAVGLLRELVVRVRQRDRVLEGWGLGRWGPGGRGVKALFAGDSGTGKTRSAEVVAGELGLDLYVIDLATVVDKYVGETEKNLDRIFAEADRVNGVLLFDEADALFGKRSEVRDAHDRYANVEVAYLLQRMELFEGLAVLTTNLRSNLDEAFARRLDSIVDFPMPEEGDRRRLWSATWPPACPAAAISTSTSWHTPSSCRAATSATSCSPPPTWPPTPADRSAWRT